MARLDPLPIYYLVYLTVIEILGTVPLYVCLEVMLVTVTATPPIFEYQSLPTQLPIKIPQSGSEDDTRAWHQIHPSRSNRAYTHV